MNMDFGIFDTLVFGRRSVLEMREEGGVFRNLRRVGRVGIEHGEGQSRQNDRAEEKCERPEAGKQIRHGLQNL